MSIAGRFTGAAQKIAGKVKQAVGKAANDPDLEQKGLEEEATGEARQELEKKIEQAKGAGEQAAGRAKSTIGAATGDASREAEGKIEEIEGQIRRKAND